VAPSGRALLRTTRRARGCRARRLIAVALCGLLSAAGPARSAPVIFDTDMAIDDWFALLWLARAPDAELIGVTMAASGESRCAPSLANAASLLEVAGQTGNVTLACGPEPPLDGWFVFPAAWRHDAETLSGVDVPASDRPHVDPSRPIADVLHELVAKAETPPVIVATGPLTNIELWLDAYPDDAGRVERLVVMGGAFDAPGNMIVPGFTDHHPNRFAEWNLYIDPVAAAQVFEADVPTTLVPLDATNQVQVDAEYAAAWKTGIESDAARFVDRVFDVNDWFIASGEYYFWDVLAAIVAFDPSLCIGDEHPVRVAHDETEARWVAGSDFSYPAERHGGGPRRHLDPATAGITREAEEGTPVRICRDSDRQKVLARFREVINR